MGTWASDSVMVLLRAVGGGLLVAAVALILCRFVLRLTAPVRFWLWWLVGAKLVVGLLLAAFGVGALRIPVLPEGHFNRLRRLATRTVRRAVPTVRKSVPLPRSVPAETSAIAVSAVAAPRAATTAPLPPLSTVRAETRTLGEHAAPFVIVFYLLGIGGFTARILRDSAVLRRLLSGATACDDPGTLSDAAEIARRFGLRRAPRLLVSADIPAPLLYGALRPTVVLPSSLFTAPSPLRRMALAHEMAHLKRGDLILAWVPVLARVLFWFFPVAHFAVREVATAREEACDLLAIAVCETSPAAYGSLLISVAAKQKSILPAPALGMAASTSPAFVQIRRRLRTLQREGKPLPPLWRGVALVLLGAQAAITVLPLRPALARAAEVARAVLPSTTPLPQFTLIDLGTLGGRHSGASAINDAGEAVGTSNIFQQGSRGHAFLHDGKTLQDIAAGSVYRHSFAAGVNRNGQVVGWAFRSSYRSLETYPFFWNGKKRSYLPVLSRHRFGRATAINDAGWIVGVSSSGQTDDQGATAARPVLWRAGAPADLGTLGGRYGYALGISDTGVIVGKADLPDTPEGTRQTHPFVTTADSVALHDLGTLGGANGAAYGVNDSGLIVGYAQTTDGATHAFATQRDGGDSLHDLGTLPGGTDSAAFAVSENGIMVGQSSGADGTLHATLWRGTNDSARDLNDLLTPEARAQGWRLETAHGINSHGQIVGTAVVNGQRRAFLLTPAP